MATNSCTPELNNMPLMFRISPPLFVPAVGAEPPALSPEAWVGWLVGWLAGLGFTGPEIPQIRDTCKQFTLVRDPTII